MGYGVAAFYLLLFYFFNYINTSIWIELIVINANRMQNSLFEIIATFTGFVKGVDYESTCIQYGCETQNVFFPFCL
jgi:hypothetical protein